MGVLGFPATCGLVVASLYGYSATRLRDRAIWERWACISRDGQIGRSDTVRSEGHPNRLWLSRFIGSAGYTPVPVSAWQSRFWLYSRQQSSLDLWSRRAIGPIGSAIAMLCMSGHASIADWNCYCARAVPYALNCGETRPVSGDKGKRPGRIVAVRSGKRTVRSLWCVSRTQVGSCGVPRETGKPRWLAVPRET